MSNDWYAPGDRSADLTYGGGGGGLGPYRDSLDARRSGRGGPFTPDAQYPDGYIGQIKSRRGDRLLDALKYQLNKRSYIRGVHKGDKIPPEDYVWPDWFNPKTSLKLEAQGKKFAPKGLETERLVQGGRVNVASPEEMAKVGARYGQGTTQYTTARLRNLAPSWK